MDYKWIASSLFLYDKLLFDKCDHSKINDLVLDRGASSRAANKTVWTHKFSPAAEMIAAISAASARTAGISVTNSVSSVKGHNLHFCPWGLSNGHESGFAQHYDHSHSRADLWNITRSSSFYPRRRSGPILPQYVHKVTERVAKNVCLWGRAELWPPNSAYFLESDWTFVPDVIKFPPGVPEISTEMGRTSDNPKT